MSSRSRTRFALPTPIRPLNYFWHLNILQWKITREITEPYFTIKSINKIPILSMMRVANMMVGYAHERFLQHCFSLYPSSFIIFPTPVSSHEYLGSPRILPRFAFILDGPLARLHNYWWILELAFRRKFVVCWSTVVHMVRTPLFGLQSKTRSSKGANASLEKREACD